MQYIQQLCAVKQSSAYTSLKKTYQSVISSIHPSRNNITSLTSPSSIQNSSSNPVSKIQEEATTHSKISNQEPISSSSSSTASTKRTLSGRSPQLQPFDQVSRPNRKIKSHNIDFIMNPQATLDFGPIQQPTHQSPVLTVEQPPDFGLPSSVPDWFRPFQARLLHVESLVQENQRLREELKVAQTRIAELEAPQAQQPQQQPKPRAGTEASKWKSTPPPPPPQPTATSAPYKAAALKGKKTAPPAHKPPTTRPRKVLSTRQLQVVARTFTPVSGTHGYQYIYLPCRFRESIGNARAKLAKLRLENSRILHLYYPTSRVVAILVHNDYVDLVLTTLNKAGIKPLEEFNPRDPTNLRDSKFADLTNVERHLKMCEIHTASLLRALDRVRVEVRPSVARSFFNKSWITQEQYQDFLHKSHPPRQDTTKTKTSFLDVIMNEVDPQDQPSPTGAGEPAEEI